jgi:hypothetical protein
MPKSVMVRLPWGTLKAVCRNLIPCLKGKAGKLHCVHHVNLYKHCRRDRCPLLREEQ